jgi:hypothetical protein
MNRLGALPYACTPVFMERKQAGIALKRNPQEAINLAGWFAARQMEILAGGQVVVERVAEPR